MADEGASLWWTPDLNPKGLTQGDIVTDVPIGTAHLPLTFLGRDTWPKGGKKYWPETKALDPFKTDSTGLFIARGRVSTVLIISHSCELDEKPDVSRVLVALTASIEQVQGDQAKQTILEQRRQAFMPLPEVPGLGSLYADLRCIGYVDRKLVRDKARACSMTDEGIVRLRSQLIAFFTRLDPLSLAGQLANDLAAEK